MKSQMNSEWIDDGKAILFGKEKNELMFEGECNNFLFLFSPLFSNSWFKWEKLPFVVWGRESTWKSNPHVLYSVKVRERISERERERREWKGRKIFGNEVFYMQNDCCTYWELLHTDLLITFSRGSLLSLLSFLSFFLSLFPSLSMEKTFHTIHFPSHSLWRFLPLASASFFCRYKSHQLTFFRWKGSARQMTFLLTSFQIITYRISSLSLSTSLSFSLAFSVRVTKNREREREKQQNWTHHFMMMIIP